MKPVSNSASLCNFCRHLPRLSTISKTRSTVAFTWQQRWLSQSGHAIRNSPATTTRRETSLAQSCKQNRRPLATATSTQSTTVKTVRHLPNEDLAELHERVEELTTTILQHPTLPSEEDVSKVLEAYKSIVRTLSSRKTSPPTPAKPSAGSTATSALLSSLEKQYSQNAVTKAELLDLISDRALEIIDHEPVFITSPILKSYVELQSALERPESFPLVFDLYRFKPVPRPTKSQPITYTNQNPNKPAAAILPAIADIALDAAIAVRDLPLALAIVDTTYCTTAYKRSKFLRSALFPIAGAVLTPPAAYTLASKFSDWQNTMDPTTATQIAMAGILTYTTSVATVGYMALTTANDQMVRVTWATGMPLWERWVREEERGAVDKLAQAWGFTNRSKWGEEEGEEWDSLREWVGLRGMWLDRVSLMDGME
ncbi:hypothetical protein BDV97DRAFT_342422 [Delphinella strobiligena]|nr:hypothetical protein BDV97DRAFT_342422 [Delphinella strobiligena]